MARNDESRPDGSDREPLDRFEDRFGRLADRYEQAAHPELDRREMPTAEHPQSIEAREQADAAQDGKEPHDIWPGRESQSDFNSAAQNAAAPEQRQGRGSRQVGEDAPEHNLPPPRNAEDQDRATHSSRMASDDAFARRPMNPSYYDRLSERIRQAQLEQRAKGPDQGQDQAPARDYEQSR